MKAKDITPGEYEVRQYKGGERKAVITKVEKRIVDVMPAGTYQNYPTPLWRAIEVLPDGKEFLWSLAQVIRPWAEAIPERDAAEANRQAGLALRHKLQEALGSHVESAEVAGGISDKVRITLSREDAAKVADALNRVPRQA